MTEARGAQVRPAGADRHHADGGREPRLREGRDQGFMKILVDKETKQFLGASFFGLDGDEVIHTVLDQMYAKAPYTVMRARDAHPSDRDRAAADDAAGVEGVGVTSGDLPPREIPHLAAAPAPCIMLPDNKGARHGLAVRPRQQGRHHHRLEPRHRPLDRRALRAARRQGGGVEPQGRRLRGGRGRHQGRRAARRPSSPATSRASRRSRRWLPAP